jgi:Gram-negative bacterial TonB protein C-terminal
LVYLHHVLPPEIIPAQPQVTEPIYYIPAIPDSAKRVPRIAPTGLGGRPGNAVQPQPAALGSTAMLKNLIAVSKPQHPDNHTQTILQPKTPDLRIREDVPLPMIVIGNPNLPKPATKIDPHDTKAIQAQKQYATETAPSLSATQLQSAIIPVAEPTVARPQLPIPTGEARPVQRSGGSAAASSATAPDIPAGGDRDLLVMGINTGPANTPIPPGNRYGDFSLSADGGKAGSPSGNPNFTSPGGGSGVEGSGGNGSVGVGAGKSGGGGNSSGSLPVSITGTGTLAGGSGSGGVLSAAAAIEEMIVPVITTPHVRKNGLVVSGGPIGGGGLGVYKVLNCGKIYTVFIPMPGTNWSLEYCAHVDGALPPPPEVSRTVVHLEQPVLPPDATVKFDFLRLPVTLDKKRKFLVLKGFIDEKGGVSNVEVYSGLIPAMDEAARTAFSRWKFMPALRDGKPVAVDILVGILPTAPDAQ